MGIDQLLAIGQRDAARIALEHQGRVLTPGQFDPGLAAFGGKEIFDQHLGAVGKAQQQVLAFAQANGFGGHAFGQLKPVQGVGPGLKDLALAWRDGQLDDGCAGSG